MPAPTQQELALQAKYAKLRKKQEEKAKKQQSGQQANAAAPKAPYGGAAPSVPAAAPLTAQERAKVLLAKKTPAEPKAASALQPAARAAPVDPKAAAKLLLASKAAKSGTAHRLPTLKRPTVQRPRQKPSPRKDSRSTSPEQPSASGTDAWPDGPAGSDVRQERRASQGEGRERSGEGSRQGEGRSTRPEPRSRRDDVEHRSKRARLSEECSERRGTREDGESTVFVGDLPPGFSEEEVVHLFTPLGDLQEVRVMGSQCYAFVTFRSERDASEVIRRFATHPMMAGGHQLRINRAYGQLPEWKRGPAIVREKRPGETLESYEHPKVREARLAGVALANQIHMAGMHGINLNAPPQERMLVSYDDL